MNPPDPTPPSSANLSKRERQVFEAITRLGRATGRDIEREIPDAPTYSAVRSILRILTQKGYLTKERDEDGRDWYFPAAPVTQVKRSAVRDFVRSFFAGSAVDAACALLGQKNVKLTPAEADKLINRIKEARKE